MAIAIETADESQGCHTKFGDCHAHHVSEDLRCFTSSPENGRVILPQSHKALEEGTWAAPWTDKKIDKVKYLAVNHFNQILSYSHIFPWPMQVSRNGDTTCEPTWTNKNGLGAAPPLYPAKIEIKPTTHGEKYVPSTIQGRISLMSMSSAEIAIESPRMSQHSFRAQLAANWLSVDDILVRHHVADYDCSIMVMMVGHHNYHHYSGVIFKVFGIVTSDDVHNEDYQGQ